MYADCRHLSTTARAHRPINRHFCIDSFRYIRNYSTNRHRFSQTKIRTYHSYLKLEQSQYILKSNRGDSVATTEVIFHCNADARASTTTIWYFDRGWMILAAVCPIFFALNGMKKDPPMVITIVNADVRK